MRPHAPDSAVLGVRLAWHRSDSPALSSTAARGGRAARADRRSHWWMSGWSLRSPSAPSSVGSGTTRHSNDEAMSGVSRSLVLRVLRVGTERTRPRPAARARSRRSTQAPSRAPPSRRSRPACRTCRAPSGRRRSGPCPARETAGSSPSPPRRRRSPGPSARSSRACRAPKTRDRSRRGRRAVSRRGREGVEVRPGRGRRQDHLRIGGCLFGPRVHVHLRRGVRGPDRV